VPLRSYFVQVSAFSFLAFPSGKEIATPGNYVADLNELLILQGLLLRAVYSVNHLLPLTLYLEFVLIAAHLSLS
jgi:hypothetical protein